MIRLTALLAAFALGFKYARWCDELAAAIGQRS